LKYWKGLISSKYFRFVLIPVKLMNLNDFFVLIIQIENGEFLTNGQADKEIVEWLNKSL